VTLYVAAYKATGKFTDKAVRAVLSIRHNRRVQYSHVELLKEKPILVSQTSLDYVQHVTGASKRDDRKVRGIPLYFYEGHWDFVELPHVPNVDVWEEAKTLIGRPYDTVGAILCVTPWARLRQDMEWCSGMIADICEWDNPETYDPHMVVAECIRRGGKLMVG
jgi:hypothetical protein